MQRDPFPALWFEPLEDRRMLAAVFPTDLEQYMVELINQGRADPNAEAARWGIALNEGLPLNPISATPKQPLAINPFLTDSAREHTRWQIENDVVPNIISHDETPGTPFFRGASILDRIEAAGYEFEEFPRGHSENVAARFPIPLNENLVRLMHGQLFVDEGVASRGHRLNLMDDDFREVGVGALTGPTNGNTWAIITQNFTFDGDGAPGDGFGDDAENFITGVVYVDQNSNDFYTPGEGRGNITITATPVGGGAPFVATTWSAGGYSLAVPNGTYDVTATGTGFTTITVQNVVVNGLNKKVDFVPGEAPPPPPDPADILAQNVQIVGSGDFIIGTSRQVKVTVKNQGETATGAFPVKLFRSTNNTLGGDTEVGSQNVANLAPNATTTLTFDVDIDAGWPVGDWFFIGQADPADVVDETDENNNTVAAASAVSVAAAPPPPDPADIVAASVEVLNGAAFVPGDKPQVRVTLRNDGETATGAFPLRLFRSTDNTLGGDVEVGEANIANLAAGVITTVTFTLTIGNDVDPQNYFFIAQADPGDVIDESNENNNVAASPASVAVSWLTGTIGARKNVKLVVADALGVPVTFLLKGAGQAAVTVSGGGGGFNVAMTGTDMTSTLTVTTPKGTESDLNDITSDGDVKSLTFKTMDVNGDITLAGATTKIQGDDIADQHVITIGAPIAALPKPPQVTLQFDEIDDLSVDSEIVIKAITAIRWWDRDGTADTVEAPAVLGVTTKFDAKRVIDGEGDFEADVLAGAGVLGKSVNKVTVAGVLRNGSIVGAANVGNVTAGRMENASVYAGIAVKPGSLPANLNAFGAFTLANVTLKGIVGGGPSFVNSNIGAKTITKIVLKDVDETNNGTDFGVIATTLKSLARVDDDGQPIKLALPPAGETSDNDFAVRIA